MDPNVSDSSLQKTSPTQDPAMFFQLSSEVSAQVSVLATHQQQIQRLTSLTEELVKTLQTLHVTAPTVSSTPASAPATTLTTTVSTHASHGIRLSLPEKYDGSPSKCKGFLMQCYICINQQPLTYSTDESRVAFVCSLLTGKALEWATAMWQGNHMSFPTYDCFIRQFQDVYEHSASGGDTGEELIVLRQGHSTAAKNTLAFRTLAAQTGWEDEPLRLFYRKGLNHDLQSELACREEGRTMQFI
uniref:DUF4939 domain-containing protein n=1 Tax=Cyprinus carpio carpio TaxID=630221 RepID=A0A9J8CDU5_CYPCA